MGGQTIHTALAVDVDRFDDAYLEAHVIPVITHEGKPVTVGQLRVLCFDYRNRGYECFPPCDHTDEKGHCLGHPTETD